MYVAEKDVGRLTRAELGLVTQRKAEHRQEGSGNLPSCKCSGTWDLYLDRAGGDREGIVRLRRVTPLLGVLSQQEISYGE